MKNLGKDLTLSELAQRGFVLLDTCALLSPWSKVCANGKGAVFDREMNEASADFFKRALKKNPGGILITSEVSKEYFNPDSPSEGVKGKDLIRAFEATRGIVCFEGKQKNEYDMLYDFFKSTQGRLKISEIDYTLDLSGMVLARHNNLVYVISRDRNLHFALESMSKKAGISPENLKRYYRSNFDEFNPVV